MASVTLLLKYKFVPLQKRMGRGKQYEALHNTVIIFTQTTVIAIISINKYQISLERKQNAVKLLCHCLHYCQMA